MSGDESLSDPFIDNHGYLGWLGIRIEAFDDGRAVLRLPRDEKLENPGSGAVHGGVVATMVDLASAIALRNTFDEPAGGSLTTTDLNVSYLRPARGDLLATGDVVRAGGTTGVAQVTVEGEASESEDPVVAVGRGTFRLFR